MTVDNSPAASNMLLMAVHILESSTEAGTSCVIRSGPTRRTSPQLQGSRSPGLQVIELSSFVAAPLAGMTLAQLGADAIRIDPINGPGNQHRWPVDAAGGSLYMAGLNKGKQSTTVGLRSAADRKLVRDVIASCAPRSAVVVTNASGNDRLGYDALREVPTDLIYMQIQGRSDGTPAVDYTVNVEMGLPVSTGSAISADPVNQVPPAWDIACGLFAATGIASAARHREVTGEGISFTVALSDVALSTAGNLGMLAEAELTGKTRPKIGNHFVRQLRQGFP